MIVGPLLDSSDKVLLAEYSRKQHWSSSNHELFVVIVIRIFYRETFYILCPLFGSVLIWSDSDLHFECLSESLSA